MSKQQDKRYHVFINVSGVIRCLWVFLCVCVWIRNLILVRSFLNISLIFFSESNLFGVVIFITSTAITELYKSLMTAISIQWASHILQTVSHIFLSTDWRQTAGVWSVGAWNCGQVTQTQVSSRPFPSTKIHVCYTLATYFTFRADRNLSICLSASLELFFP